jgi:hypothetical protein
MRCWPASCRKPPPRNEPQAGPPSGEKTKPTFTRYFTAADAGARTRSGG